MPPYTGNGIPHTTSIWKLHHDKTGNLWALGYITSIYDSASEQFIPVTKKWSHLKLLDSVLFDVIEDSNGLMYFNTNQNEIIRYNPFTLHAEKLQFHIQTIKLLTLLRIIKCHLIQPGNTFILQTTTGYINIISIKKFSAN